MIVKPWWLRFSQRTERAPIVQVTSIAPVCQLRPLLSATGVVPTKVSWLSRARIGRPTEPRNTKPGSPNPVLGAGIGRALQSTWVGGVLGGWIAMPHPTSPSSAVHSGAPDVEPSAGAGATMASAQRAIRNRR